LREKKKKKKTWSTKDDQFHKLRTYTRHNSTFNPKIHYMSSHGTGYQMKNDVKTDPKESSGMVLKHMFQKKT
jgi:hypothetical protein